MKAFAKLVPVIFVVLLLFQQGASMDQCSGISTIVEATTPEARYEVTRRVIENIAPAIFSNISTRLSINSSDPIGVAYTVLSESFGIRVSESGFNTFASAVDEISIAQAEACSGVSTISTSDTERFIQEFQAALDLEDRDSDLSLLRSLYGQLLCIDSGDLDNPPRKRRQLGCPPRNTCVCPPGGIHGMLSCSCEFFRCLENSDILAPILGFSTEVECLAFVIDTTGSMAEEISAAKEIILNFVRSEEEIGIRSCYVLVPFNDIGPDHLPVHEESVGPVSVAYTVNPAHLQAFYNAVIGLSAVGGGDAPEYALYGIQQALRATSNISGSTRDVMTRGSQIVVITDAPSKQENLTNEVINEALKRKVCIHFFLSNDPTQDGIYETIANETFGILIRQFENGELATFIAAYSTTPCQHSVGITPTRRKRQVVEPTEEASPSTCQAFTINQFAILLKLTINAPTGTVVNITRPDLSNNLVTSGTGNFVVLSEGNPQPGNWQACSINGASISVSSALTLEIDTTLIYQDEGKVSTSIPPPACTGGKVALLTSQANNIEQARLDLVDRFGDVQYSIPLSRCTGALVSDQTYFPLYEGLIYHLVGRDSRGVDFVYDTNIDITFDDNRNRSSYSYELTSTGPPIVNIWPGRVSTWSFSLENLNDYSSKFEFSMTVADGINAIITSTETEVGAGQSLVIAVEVQIANTVFGEGNSSSFSLIATNDCSMLTASQILRESKSSSSPSIAPFTVFVHLWITVGILHLLSLII